MIKALVKNNLKNIYKKTSKIQSVSKGVEVGIREQAVEDDRQQEALIGMGPVGEEEMSKSVVIRFISHNIYFLLI